MLSPVLVTPPAELPISIEEMKQHLRVDHDDEDELIDGFLRAGTSYLDGYTGVLGRAFVSQTWRQDYQEFPCSGFYVRDGDTARGVLRLPLFPVTSITSVKYSDITGVEQTQSSGQYRLMKDALGYFIAPVAGTTFTGWPSTDCRPDAVRVTFVAGVAAADVDEADKTIIRQLVAGWYENRESVVIGSTPNEIPYGIDVLIAARRRVSFG